MERQRLRVQEERARASTLPRTGVVSDKDTPDRKVGQKSRTEKSESESSETVCQLRPRAARGSQQQTVFVMVVICNNNHDTLYTTTTLSPGGTVPGLPGLAPRRAEPSLGSSICVYFAQLWCITIHYFI